MCVIKDKYTIEHFNKNNLKSYAGHCFVLLQKALASLHFEENCNAKGALHCDQFLIGVTQWLIQDNFPFKN